MCKSAFEFLICIVFCLSFSTFAQAQSTDAVFYKQVKGWTINQYGRSENSAFGPSCSAVKFNDNKRDGIRLERYNQGYRYGINGLTREKRSTFFALRLWFDQDDNSRYEGTARFVRDVAYPDDDWLSHHQPFADGPIGELAKRDAVTFSFVIPNQYMTLNTIKVDFELVGSAATLLALDACYEEIFDRSIVAYPESGCPDQGPRFAGSGVCQSRARNYLTIFHGEAPELMDGCVWAANEAAMPGGDYLFYLAASCGGRTSKLEFSAGAKFAEVSVASSAMNDGKPGGKIITVRTIDEDDPYKNILQLARDAMEDKVAAARCLVRPAAEDRIIADELVVDYSIEEAAKEAEDGPRYACGPYGYDDEAWTFWRVFGGYSWFFDFGKGGPEDIDPASLTVVRAEDLPG